MHITNTYTKKQPARVYKINNCTLYINKRKEHLNEEELKQRKKDVAEFKKAVLTGDVKEPNSRSDDNINALVS